VNENVDRRVLGAFAFVDAITNGVIEVPLEVQCADWTIRPNRRAVYVIFDGPGMSAATAEFVPIASSWPASVQMEISVSDPSGAYLPRRAQIKGIPAQAPTVQNVTLFPSPASGTAPNWFILYASVQNSATSSGLPWTVLQITTAASTTPVATGMSDARGEALLAVTGLKAQIATSGTGYAAVTTSATVRAWYDPAFASQPAAWVPDPDDVLTNLTNTTLHSATQTTSLAPGSAATLRIPIAI
jgi:hypothetical protein